MYTGSLCRKLSGSAAKSSWLNIRVKLTQTFGVSQVCQVLFIQHDFSRRQIKYLPVANLKFAVYPIRNLPSVSETLAVGKLLLCRRQTENLQSASAPLAIGKFFIFKREIFCQWKMESFFLDRTQACFAGLCPLRKLPSLRLRLKLGSFSHARLGPCPKRGSLERAVYCEAVRLRHAHSAGKEGWAWGGRETTPRK